MTEHRPVNLREELARLPHVLSVHRSSWSRLECWLDRNDRSDEPLMVNVWRGLFRRRPHSKDLEGAAAFLAELDAREGDLREWGETLTPSDFPVLEEVVPIDWKSTVIEGMGIGGRLPAGAVELLLYEHVGTEDLLFRHWNVEWRDGVFGQLELWTSY